MSNERRKKYKPECAFVRSAKIYALNRLGKVPMEKKTKKP